MTRHEVGLKNADSVAVIDVASQRVKMQIGIGQAPQALVFVANAVPSGAGTTGLGRQNLGLRIEHRTLAVPNAPAARAKAVIRNLGALDAVEISARGLTAGATYDAYAVQNMTAPYGRAVKLVRVMAKGDGTVDAAAQLAFFDSGFTTVVLTAPGELPSGSSLSVLAVPVLEVASADHCAMH